MDEMNDVDFELLLVNDGSKDKTLEIMMELASNDSRVKYISFSRNFGKEAAMYAGFENSTGDYVCLMDADLQDPPRLLPEMLKAIREEDTIVQQQEELLEKVNHQFVLSLQECFIK